MGMKQPIYLICGVSGAGKTWVCRQLVHKFHYVPHDEHYRDLEDALMKAAEIADRPVLTEVPFAERKLRADLQRGGYEVRPYFVIEDKKTVAERYKSREGREAAKNVLTRADSIIKRAREWDAPYGTSKEIFDKLS